MNKSPFKADDGGAKFLHRVDRNLASIPFVTVLNCSAKRSGNLGIREDRSAAVPERTR